MPDGQWEYYQEWNNALFLHWAVPVEIISNLVHKDLPIDTFEGKAWVSLVAFTMEKIRPRILPHVKYVSNFHEINLRTYINYKDKPGVYFLNIEGEKSLSVFVAKALSGLPYEKALMKRENNIYCSLNKSKQFSLDTSFTIKEHLNIKSELDKWLTERYCLYHNKKDKLFRYQIHHIEWPLYDVILDKLQSNYIIGNLDLNSVPNKQHYSSGVQVIAWGSEKLN